MTQEILGNDVHVVSALHNVAATALAKSETPDGEVRLAVTIKKPEKL